ncbi:MAG: RNA polymerase subunit sigma-70, partial [Clostridia bacterium]|nr:RNA polymerase subunit sigma-70 [Clostridia bacterium]
MEDFQIIKLFNERSEEAIAETKNKYGRYCFSIARAIVGDEGEAEECVSDTYLKAWNTIPPAAPKQLSTYLSKITRNLAIHRYERKNAEKRGGGEIEMLFSELSEVVAGEENASREGSADSMTDALA